MKVVAFNGSPRKNGNTYILIDTVLEEIKKANIETEQIQLSGEKISGCIACRKCITAKNKRCAIDDDILNFCIDKMIQADVIILGSPVYFADVTSQIKALIDRAGYVARANDYMLKYKIGASVVAVRRAGAIHAFDTLNHFFLINQMIVVGSSYWNIGVGRNIGDVNEDEEGIQTMKTLGQNITSFLTKPNRVGWNGIEK